MNLEKKLALSRKQIGAVFRASRKQLGLSQVNVSKSLGLQQSALSRIESGKQELGACDMMMFCRDTNTPMESFFTGVVDQSTPALLQHGREVAGYRLPPRYADARGSKVRAMLPFLRYAEHALGTRRFHEMLRARKIDPDFFVNLDNQINILFCLDLSSDLIAKGVLNSRDIAKVAAPVSKPETHGMLHHLYDHTEPGMPRLASLVSSSKFYECNFDYALGEEKRGYADLVVRPARHLPALLDSDSPEMAQLLCRYKKSYFQNFSSYGNSRGGTLTEEACYFKGDEACVYRLRLAS